MRPRPRFLVLAAFALGIAAAAFTGGALAERALTAQRAQPDPPAASAPASPSPDFSLIRRAWDIINREYVDRSALKPDRLTDGIISGMVDALGDTGHSTYLTPEMVADERSLMQGEYVGVGLEIAEKNGNVVIVAPIDGSPAVAAGLRAGDRILRVDGKSVADLDVDQVVKMIAGPAGTIVTLSIFSPASRATSEVSLKRTRIHVHSVSWEPLPGSRYADLRVASFSTGATREIGDALSRIESRGLAGIVLDLRNNPGGELHEAIGVASEFLSGGDVLLEKDAKGRIRHDAVRRGGAAPRIPLVVLINDGTASGAEIVAGALQDARRAPLVGETTFGTGTVLRDFPLPDGSALLLAVREWLTPAGRSIWHTGIKPDVAIALPADAALLTPESLRGAAEGARTVADDPQMKKAVQLLDGMTRPAGSRRTSVDPVSPARR